MDYIINETEFLKHISGTRHKKRMINNGKVTVYDYILQKPKNFLDKEGNESMILRELRGIAFDQSGNLLCLPIYKFWNLGNSLASIDDYNKALKNDDDVEFTIKMDGSMVNAYLLDGTVYFKCKKSDFIMPGVTDNVEFNNECKKLLLAGICPIFEHISPTRRIVIKYKKDKLIMIAMRDIKNGRYFTHKEMSNTYFKCTEKYDLNESLIDFSNNHSDIEGLVAFSPKYKKHFKIKTSWYKKRHLEFSKYLDSKMTREEYDLYELKKIKEYEDKVAEFSKTIPDIYMKMKANNTFKDNKINKDTFWRDETIKGKYNKSIIFNILMDLPVDFKKIN